MDIEMPGMDGLEATRRIKTRWPDIGVIVLTMYPAYRTKALDAGADGFFSKAALPDEWLTWLRVIAAGGTQ
jgi:DNA-binding NarL/FixJ family response regulator